MKIDYGEEIYGCFHKLSPSQKEKVMSIVAIFHIRNGKRNPDGSMGEIVITNRELNDCLSAMWIKDINDKGQKMYTIKDIQ